MVDLRQNGQILYISTVDISLGNGPGVNEREFIFALNRMFGSRVHFLIPDPRNEVSEINRHNFALSHSHRQHYPPSYFIHLISQFRLANSLLSSGKFDFIVFRLSDLPLVESCITRRYNKIPYAVKTLGMLDALLQQTGLKGILGKLLAPVGLTLFRDLATRAVAIDACTQILIDYHQSRLGLPRCKLRLIENSTNTDRFYPIDKMKARSRTGLRAFDPIVGYVGGRPWDRGGNQMVEVAPNLLKRYSSLGMVIVGEGPGLERLKMRTRELGIDGNFVFVGAVPYDRVPDFINAFDVCISFDTKDRLKTYGNSSQKVRQYLACGKPVVSGPGGNHFLEKERLGSIVEVNDLEQIRNALIFWLCLTEEQHQAFRLRAREFATKHLSVRKALDDRIDLWNDKLGTLQSKPPKCSTFK